VFIQEHSCSLKASAAVRVALSSGYPDEACNNLLTSPASLHILSGVVRVAFCLAHSTITTITDFAAYGHSAIRLGVWQPYGTHDQSSYCLLSDNYFVLIQGRPL
jgi:hypothetical protein